MITAKQLRRSAGLYPITMLYIAGVSLITAVAGGLAVAVAIVMLGFFAILAAFYATWRELRSIHKLVDGQRTELLARIDQLSHLLHQQGVTVPVGTKVEQDARNDTIRKGLAK